MFRVNDIDLELKLYIPINLYKTNKSFQIAFFDFYKNAYSIKAVNQDEIINELLIVNILRKNKTILIDFYNDIKKLIEKKKMTRKNINKYAKMCL